ncbi:N-acetylmuramoyl-L-alanine amidase [Yoonia vestfoldensis]|uniref:N-acetylmuramoyl-L-alanine amidase n=1 Tax=Yoonia vestfoldensis TaxID=245188 RepID=A0A1Y0EA63_9RHOB|nr:N-acetylmuramoyl-L-alanine amidase [Yoonia vestfoldensis]ARU00515.1 N-acetylmuramoyl-L-alanine amidase AmiA [Yoonia vestfoldensis]
MIRWFVLCCLLATSAGAQARFDPERSEIRDGWRSVQITLGLSDIVPYRIFTLDDPRRLVLDFQGLDSGGINAQAINTARRVTDIRFGPYRPGWTRMVLDLAEPLTLAEAEMTRDGQTAWLHLRLTRTSPADFAAAAGAPPDPGWDALSAQALRGLDQHPQDSFVVVLDPGHGGIDPGAQRGGITEAHLMLEFAAEIAARLRAQDGVAVVMTREADVFVPLFTRMSIARGAGADLFISLHADALEQDDAWGASVYTLSEDSDDIAMQRLVERHERGDLLAGVDLSATGDRVTGVLMDLARQSTGPRAAAFADQLIAQMQAQGVRLNAKPRRMGRFSVLLAADFPSVLIEAGFLSNTQDRQILTDPQSRARLVTAIAAAVAQYRSDMP